MTAPVPAPQLSPTAGLMNALARHYIRLAGQRIADLEAAIAAAKTLDARIRTETNSARRTALRMIRDDDLETL